MSASVSWGPGEPQVKGGGASKPSQQHYTAGVLVQSWQKSNFPWRGALECMQRLRGRTGWMGEWRDGGWIGGRVDGRMDTCVDGRWIYGYIHSIDGWMGDGWMKDVW